MTNRILDFSDRPVHLSVSLSRLIIEADGTECVAIPLSEIAVILSSHPQITFTNAVLSGLAANNGVFVTCNDQRYPTGMLLPLNTNGLQQERFEAQARASLPVKKRLWQQIVQAKIRAQAKLLDELGHSSNMLAALSEKVKSGDPENVEGHAARIYWSSVFDDTEFRRDPVGKGRNMLLNYGYTVLRSMTVRAICAAGLHPSLGLHHHNRYDTFCLADDLMEPYRPLVDKTVVGITKMKGNDVALDRETKPILVAALIQRYENAGECRSLFEWLVRLSFSLAEVFQSKTSRLSIAEV
jgi:CRISPR-associated protein Cas1